MTIEDNSNRDYKKIFKIVAIIAALLVLLWVNYCHFKKHISSNPEKISNYVQENNNMDKFRVPAVAGLFYPADAEVLDADVGGYLSSGRSIQNIQPKLLIVPHAGYMYSAKTAAQAYLQLEPFKKQIKNVILVGPSHHVGFKGFALSDDDYFITPLGKIAVNKEINHELKQNQNFGYSVAAHKDEHSLEVQLPFLQKVLKNFEIVPILYGSDNPQALAEALSPYLNRKDTLIVFSADLSHYYTYEEAQKLDASTGALIAARSPEIENHMSCGAIGINTAILLSRQNRLYPQLLDMVNSGDITGDKSGVVGYASWLFSDENSKSQAPALSLLEQETQNLRMFAGDYGAELMKIARMSVNEAVKKNKRYRPARSDFADIMFNRGAAFVTLEENGELRGCIGSLMPVQAIAYDVAQNAYAAAMEDSRFAPVKPQELKDLKISISLLTGFEPITYIDEADLLKQIVAGTDGIVIRDGDRQGVFLPAVWKQLPDKQEFLNNLKLKAGMSPAYWSNRIKVYRFRVVEISEHED